MDKRGNRKYPGEAKYRKQGDEQTVRTNCSELQSHEGEDEDADRASRPRIGKGIELPGEPDVLKHKNQEKRYDERSSQGGMTVNPAKN